MPVRKCAFVDGEAAVRVVESGYLSPRDITYDGAQGWLCKAIDDQAAPYTLFIDVHSNVTQLLQITIKATAGLTA